MNSGDSIFATEILNKFRNAGICPRAIWVSSLKNKLVKDNIRDLGLDGQLEKTGTPTMGGIIILISILIPTFLLCRLNNIYVIIMIITTLWMGIIGFWDDYIKVFKNNKKGLAGRFKIIGQVLLGCIVAFVLYHLR